jgi:hypothetical protein
MVFWRKDFIGNCVLSALFLSVWGCSNTPYRQDVRIKAVSVPIENEGRVVAMSYLARIMMETDERKVLVERVSTVLPGSSFQWTNAHTSVAAQMATDVMLGGLGSSAGQVVGDAVYAGSYVIDAFADGSDDHAGQAYLPYMFEGKKLDTKEQAKQALIQFTKKRIQSLAEKYGFEYSCVYGCDSSMQIFSLKIITPLDAGLIYKPNYIIVSTVITDLVPVHKLDPVQSVINFPVRWKTNHSRGYIVNFASEPVLENGVVKVVHSEHNGAPHIYPWVKHRLINTRIGRSIYQAFHSTPYTTYGDQFLLYPKLFFYNKDAFAFYENSKVLMVDNLITERNVLTPVN